MTDPLPATTALRVKPIRIVEGEAATPNAFDPAPLMLSCSDYY